MRAAHTPGPWTVLEGDSVVHILDTSGRRLAVTDTKRYWERHDATDIANARLIAAAPDLLAALEGDIDWLDALSQMSIERDMVMVRIRAHRELIAKALGRTPIEIGDPS